MQQLGQLGTFGRGRLLPIRKSAQLSVRWAALENVLREERVLHGRPLRVVIAICRPQLLLFPVLLFNQLLFPAIIH